MKIVFVTSAEKELLKLDTLQRLKIFDKIMTLGTNPYQEGSQKLGGSSGYRVRIGRYRVIYTVNKENKVVTIIKVAHRKDVYRK